MSQQSEEYKSARIKQLEGLFGECERFFENQTRDLEKLIQPERYLFEAKELLQKLKAARGEKLNPCGSSG